MIVIIDYNVGNVKSVLNATKRMGIEAIITRDLNLINKAEGIILPGVGSFPVAMDNLKKYNLIEILNKKKEEGVPILGICLGMQILFDEGFEGNKTKGLGYIKGSVREIKTDKKLPHMGWNGLYKNNKESEMKENILIENIKDGDDVYFVHSYMADFIDENVVAYTKYGEAKIPAIVCKGNVMGCQFHPEKSGKIGEKILLAWKEMIKC